MEKRQIKQILSELFTSQKLAVLGTHQGGATLWEFSGFCRHLGPEEPRLWHHPGDPEIRQPAIRSQGFYGAGQPVQPGG